ncbi:MAG: hypothetical protein WD716_13830 [Fimbriimonadaceae bacterium]
MKKWGPAVFIAAALGALLFWSACAEPDIARYGEVTAAELALRAEGALGPRPEAVEWSAKGLVVPALEPLGPGVADIEASSPGSHDIYQDKAWDRSDVEALERALAGTNGETSDALLERARLHALAIQCWIALNVPENALARFVVADEETKSAIATAQTFEQLQQAEAARLYFLEEVRSIVRIEGWGRRFKETLAAVAERLGGSVHRGALVRVLHARFLDEVVPEVATASATEDPADVVCAALFEEQTDEQTQLVARLLHRHRRAFSPELTADAGAGALKSLRDAMDKDWPSAQATLDGVAVAHAPWTALLELLLSDDASQVSKIADVKALLDTTENPVGLALLHEERTSWSSHVQGAFVADAKEALLKIELLIAAGKRDGALLVLDPFTGRPFTIKDESATSGLGTVPEVYPFVKSFAETEHSIGV